MPLNENGKNDFRFVILNIFTMNNLLGMKQLTMHIPDDKLQEVIEFLSSLGIENAVAPDSQILEWQQQVVLERQEKFNRANAIDLDCVEMEMKQRYGIQRVD